NPGKPLVEDEVAHDGKFEVEIVQLVRNLAGFIRGVLEVDPPLARGIDEDVGDDLPGSGPVLPKCVDGRVDGGDAFGIEEVSEQDVAVIPPSFPLFLSQHVSSRRIPGNPRFSKILDLAAQEPSLSRAIQSR